MHKFRTTTDNVEVFHQALDRLSVEELRTTIREFYRDWKYIENGPNHLQDSIIRATIKQDSKWNLPQESDDDWRMAEQVAKSLRSGAQLVSEELDELLRFASSLLVRGSYERSHFIFSHVMLGLRELTFDLLGFDECPSEVLSYDMNFATTEYAVTTYFSLPLEKRASAIFEVLEKSTFLYGNYKPLAAMISASVRALPRWQDFLPFWRDHLYSKVDELGDDGDRSPLREWLDEACAATR